MLVLQPSNPNFVVGDAVLSKCGNEIVGVQITLLNVSVGEIPLTNGLLTDNFRDDKVLQADTGSATRPRHFGSYGGQNCPIEPEFLQIGIGKICLRSALIHPHNSKGRVFGPPLPEYLEAVNCCQPSPRARKISLAASMAARVKGMPP